jgi:hypothetical protein
MNEVFGSDESTAPIILGCSLGRDLDAGVAPVILATFLESRSLLYCSCWRF